MLDSRPDTFDDRNLFLHALLGLTAACEHLDRAVAVPARAGSEEVPPDHPWLLCVLGAVAFRLRFGEIVASSRPDSVASSGTGPTAPASLRDLLR